MQKKLYRILSLILSLLMNGTLYGQEKIKDAQLWENFTTTHDLNRYYTLTINHEGRISNNMSQFYYAYFDFGIERKLSKHFKMSLNYVLAWKWAEGYDRWRHQGYVAMYYKTKLFKRFDLQWRGMYQQQYQDIYTSELGTTPENYIRNKFTLKYNFAHYPLYRFTPYLASEIYYHLDKDNKYGPQFDRVRYFAGIFYNFNKMTSLELYYLIENNFNVDEAVLNFVVGIGFERDF